MLMRISDYVFETLLGQGTFGSVYLVRRKNDSKPFVVKEQALNAVNALPFKNILGEVQCLHKLRHPNIVAYYGAWIEDDHCYILMEYATRCTLKDLLSKRPMPLKEEDALYLFSQIVLGVHQIHYKKILHRDLKPENIMLTGGRGDIVKIGDFGVSKNFQELTDPSRICRAGSFYYMAPEMLRGQCYDFKCDIWSMGVILYEMVTKRHPFPGTNLTEIVNMTCNEKPRPLSKQTSAAIVNLISKMLRKQPPSRPRTDQLMTCPHLVPFIARIYLNLGRVPLAPCQGDKNIMSEVFLKFLKPREKRITILT
ncbi:PREDICTED: serine/threonine-protein kinase Nek5-like [Dufourea novaeangliae]|uniref:serine/threonine-protein kinase Nek5-like n=1 Tax=Dufourea novaeangliae TaxID=178035 RepID=UPI000767D938|nr:PREDICTED: serine/threonine-protein kinase Nek5-like [Dufourea novaeangliae]